MPLRSVILQSEFDPEDADLLEGIFNQLSSPLESDKTRRARAARLVELFVSGERDREKLIGYLVSTAPKGAHSISCTSSD